MQRSARADLYRHNLVLTVLGAHKVHVFCGTLVVYAFVAEIQWKDNNQYRIPYFVTW